MTSHTRRPPHRIKLQHIHIALGLVLIAAGSLKLSEIAAVSQPEDLAAGLLMIAGEAEVLGGLWLVAGMHAERTRPWAAAAFAGFWTAALYQGLTGKCSCGCFGWFVINPWYVVAFDQAAVAVLLLWHPVDNRPMSASSSPSMIVGLASTTTLTAAAGIWRHALFVIMGTALWGFLIFTLIAATGILLWKSLEEGETDLSFIPSRILGLALTMTIVGLVGSGHVTPVIVSGRATWDDRPLADTILSFVADSVRVETRTDADGMFGLPTVRPGSYKIFIAGDAAPPYPTQAVGVAGKKVQKKNRRPRAEWVRPRGDVAVTLNVPECLAIPLSVRFTDSSRRP